VQDAKAFQNWNGYRKTSYEHYQAIVDMEKQHNTIHEDVMLRLLAMSFFDKILDWYITLPTNSISTWAQLVEPLILKFNNVGNPYSLLSQFNVIQRHS